MVRNKRSDRPMAASRPTGRRAIASEGALGFLLVVVAFSIAGVARASAAEPAAKDDAAKSASAKNAAAKESKAESPEAKGPSAKDSNAKDAKAKDSEVKKSPAARDQKAVLTDLRAVKEKLEQVMPVMSAIADPEFRKADGPAARPLLQKSADLIGELAGLQKDAAERAGLERDRCQYLAMVATLGDGHAAATLEKIAAGHGESALVARSAIVLSKWWSDSKDAGAQEKILADYTAVAKANPKDNNVVLTLAVMATIGPAVDDMSIRTAEVLRKVMTAATAKKLAAEIDPSGAMRDLVGKPLVASGRSTLGKSFSTHDWKGKVVMLDFWATWCGPCNAEIPRMKDLYKTYHPKGLEMVGLDCDGSDDTVNSFTKEKQMPWPQLREASQSESEPWHPLAVQWGVIGVPTMFLIDKKGVLRFIDAREDTAEKIESLLAE